MAYVELRREDDGVDRPWLEGRRLEPGDPLWVPLRAAHAELVDAWWPAVFLEMNSGGGTLMVGDGRGREQVSLRIGLRRRDVMR